MHRSPRLATAVALATAALITGCGSAAPDPEPAERPSADAAFPATVEHKFGTTTVAAPPERIAVVGLTEQDTVLALGATPIATTEWYGKHPHAVWPWAQDVLGDAEPTVLSNADGFEFEKLAVLEPDLIVGTNSGMKRGDYEKLSQLAPTIAAGVGSPEYSSPWDEQVELIAAALGKPDAGKQLVQRVKDRYAVTALADRPGEQVGISAERLDTLDADVIVFATEKPADVAELRKTPTFDKLDAVAGNRSVYTDGTLAGALYFMTPLSLEYALDRLAPQLQDAVDGEAPRRVVDTTGAP